MNKAEDYKGAPDSILGFPVWIDECATIPDEVWERLRTNFPPGKGKGNFHYMKIGEKPIILMAPEITDTRIAELHRSMEEHILTLEPHPPVLELDSMMATLRSTPTPLNDMLEDRPSKCRKTKSWYPHPTDKKNKRKMVKASRRQNRRKRK